MTFEHSAQDTIHFNHDVVIIGCGPTGATLTTLLAQSGVDVLVLDKEPAIYDLPRAVHFDDETMRVFQAVGIADALQQKTRVNPGMQFVDNNGGLLLDWPRPAGIGRHGWHTSYRLHQPDLEKLLRDAIAQHVNCTLKTGNELLAFEQTGSAVELTYQDRTTGAIQNCRAKYMVGCDGANSSVRTALQVDMQDLGFNERWLVVDVLLKQDMPELGDYTVQYCSSEQPMTYCRNPGRRRRWEMVLPDSMSDEQAMDCSFIWSSLSRWLTPQVGMLERKAVYTFRSQIASRWRDQRVLLAGDAAHLTPPFMGQGMCAGIRDAANLAWKLAMVLNKTCTEALLDTYEQERLPHVREYITTAIALGTLINTLEKSSVSTIASSGDKTALQMSSIDPRLEATDLVIEPFRTSAHVGKMFDQVVLADGTRLDDLIGYQAVLISRCGSTSVKVKPAHQEQLILSMDDQKVLLALLDQWQVEAVVIRPDRYVLATFNCSIDSANLNWQSLLRYCR